MNRSDFIRVAGEVLNEEGQLDIDELLLQGKVQSAKEHLLFGIDACYGEGLISFETAAEFYRLVGLSKEGACRFRQKYVGTLYQ